MSILSFSRNIVFPNFCVGCGSWDTWLCQNCDKKIKPLNTQKKSLQNASITSSFFYASPLKELIHKFKYQKSTDIAPLLANLLRTTIDFSCTEMLTYIPQHPLRTYEREYNHTKLIAFELSKQLRIPVVSLFKKTRHTSHLANEDKEQRAKEIKHTFALNPRIKNKEKEIANQHITIVDDVTTTGATLNELFSVAQANNFTKISAVTLAVVQNNQISYNTKPNGDVLL